MGKRTKLIIGIVIFALIIFSGTVFALAKAGKINIKSFADEITSKAVTTVSANVSSTTQSGGSPDGQTVRLYRKDSSTTNLGIEIDHRTISGVVTFNLTVGYYYDLACDNSPISPQLNIYPDGSASAISVGVTCPDNGATAVPTPTVSTSSPATKRNFQIEGAVLDPTGKNFVSDAQIAIIDNSTNQDVTPKFASIASCKATSCFSGVAVVNGQFKQYNYLSTVFARPQSDTYKSISINITSPTYAGQTLSIDLSKPNQIIGTKDSGGIVIDQVVDLQFATAPPPATNTYINGKIIDSTGAPITTNLNVYAKKGGFKKPWAFNTDADFSPYDFNAVSDSSGNYKLDISPQQLTDAGNDLEICAMVSKFPTDLKHKNWGCYQLNGSSILHVNKSQTYNNIDITLSENYHPPLDTSKISIVGNFSKATYAAYVGASDMKAQCSNSCGKGPWASSAVDVKIGPYSPDELDFIIRDIPAISLPQNNITSLRISPSSIPSGWFMDLNGDGINNDPTFLDLKPSDVSTDAFENPLDRKVYVYVNLSLRPIDQYVNILGTIADNSGKLIRYAYVNRGKGSSAVSESSTKTLGSLTYNYILPPVKRSDLPDVLSFDSAMFTTLADPNRAKITVNQADIKYDAVGKFYYIKEDYELKDSIQSYSLKLYAVDTREPIDLSKENIIKDELWCWARDNQPFPCTRLDQIGPTNLLKYDVDLGALSRSRTLRFEFLTDKYFATTAGLPVAIHRSNSSVHEAGPTVDVYVMDKTKPNFGLDCLIVNSVEFCFAPSAKDELTGSQSRTVNDIATLIKTYVDKAGLVGQYPVVFIDENSHVIAYVTQNGLGIGTKGQDTVINMRIEEGPKIALHELSHVLDFISLIVNLKVYSAVDKALASAKNNHCDKEPIYNTLYIDAGGGAGAGYSLTNIKEFSAEFFRVWLTKNDDLKRTMNDAGLKLECRNVLTSLYSIFNTRYPNMPLYQEVIKKSVTSSTASSNSASNSFDQIMQDAGYTLSTRANIETISNIGNISLTPAQIASGVWLKENYDKLPTRQKLQLQLNILTTRASNSIASAGSSMQTALATLNARADSILNKLGFHISTASISGIVEDQDGPVAGIEVSFGSKVAVTDATGKYTLSRVPTGKFNLKVSDPKTNKTYKTSPDSLTIADNQQMTNINILFAKPTHTIKGQIFYKNALLANGKIVISDGQTIALDADGKFNFELKEGQYKLVIKNKSDKNLSVSNPGDFANLTKLNVTKDFDSLIWTY